MEWFSILTNYRAVVFVFGIAMLGGCTHGFESTKGSISLSSSFANGLHVPAYSIFTAAQPGCGTALGAPEPYNANGGFPAPELRAPVNRLVIQRVNGFGRLAVRGSAITSYQNTVYPVTCAEVQVCSSPSCETIVQDFTKLSGGNYSPNGTGYDFEGSVTIPSSTPATTANGFYSVRVRYWIGAGSSAQYITATSPWISVGAGEVFVIAGQSNSSWNGDYPESAVHAGSYLVPTELTATQPFRVLALDDNLISSLTGPGFTGPEIDKSVIWTRQYSGGYGLTVNAGSYWPRLAARLENALGVPIMFVPVNHGGTAIADWAPDAGACASCGESWGPYSHYLFDRLVNTVNTVTEQSGGIRAVIWHQGEAEYGGRATPGGSAQGYATLLNSIITQLRARTGQSALPFLVSTVSANIDGPEWCAGSASYPIHVNDGAGPSGVDLSGHVLCTYPALREAQRSVISNSGSVNALPNVFLGAQADQFGTAYRRNGWSGHMYDNLHLTNLGSSDVSQCPGFQTVDGYSGRGYCDGFAAMANEYFIAVSNAFFNGSYSRAPNF